MAVSAVSYKPMLNLFSFFFSFRASPAAYRNGSSQTRGRIGAVVGAYTTATATPGP